MNEPKTKIVIRRAAPEDLAELRELYINTVTTINKKDYTNEQIQAWIKPWYENSPTRDGRTFAQKIIEQYFIVAIIEDVIAGFGSIEDNGYLDFMYVHKDHQRKGVALTLLTELERYSNEQNLKEINAIVSHTAKGFFEKHGWEKIREEVVEVRGAVFTDNIMIKKLK